MYMLTIFPWLNANLSCFKQLPLNFGYAPLYVDTSAGARLLSGDSIKSFNFLDFQISRFFTFVTRPVIPGTLFSATVNTDFVTKPAISRFLKEIF